MKKMVTDNPNDNIEILLNLAFSKDNEVWIRNGSEDGKDCTLIDFTKSACKACKCHIADDLNAIEDIDHIGDFLMDCSMCNCAIGTFYFVAVQAAELRGRLRLYEDAYGVELPKDGEQDGEN